MNTTFSDDFKKFFLIKFTEQLIRNSEKIELRKLQGIIETREKKKFEPRKEMIIGLEIQSEKIPAQVRISARPMQRRITRTREIAKPSLLIPEPKLPAHLEYLRPVPTAGIEIDLWKLNPLVKDPAVRIIEVNPDEKVAVTGTMGTKQTGIILNKEDIDRVINEFAKVSKIPIEEGIYRVVAGNLIFSAVISEIVGSKFMIRKMVAPPRQQPQYASQLPQLPRLPKGL